MSKKQTTNGFDIAAFDGLVKAQDEGVTITLYDPRGDDTGARIVVAGPDSKQARKAERDMVNRQLKRRKSSKPTAEELQEAVSRKLAGFIISWNGIVADGAPVPLTIENAMAIFERAPWVAEQITDAAGDRAAFFTN